MAPGDVVPFVSRRNALMLAALALVWGASFMLIKISVRELEPTMLVCLRLGIGALALAPFAVVRLGVRRFVREMRSGWVALVFIGTVNSAVPIVALSWAEKRLDSGLAAVIQASAPLFTALLALRFSRAEVVTGPRLLGLLVGFGGVALLVGVQPSGTVRAALAVTFSALCYAIAALASARLLPGLSPLVSATGALAAGALLPRPVAASQAPSHFPSREIVGALLALGI